MLLWISNHDSRNNIYRFVQGLEPPRGRLSGQEVLGKIQDVSRERGERKDREREREGAGEREVDGNGRWYLTYMETRSG